jgi:DNA-binding response OmpR family regulator
MGILIAEDDVALAGFVRKGLESEHHAVDVSGDGEQSRALASEFDYDLVLDLNLPRLEGSGHSALFADPQTDHSTVDIDGTGTGRGSGAMSGSGADDYLVKLFSFTELSARIRVLLRRSHLPADSVLAVDDLKVDRVERRVERGDGGST